MGNILNNYTKVLILRSFELESKEGITESELEQLLANRVDYLLANQLEFFFATMYRLDVNEKRIRQALAANEGEAPLKIAQLIIQRQKEKQASREKYRSDFYDDSF